jgi:hypothetical protein
MTEVFKFLTILKNMSEEVIFQGLVTFVLSSN